MNFRDEKWVRTEEGRGQDQGPGIGNPRQDQHNFMVKEQIKGKITTTLTSRSRDRKSKVGTKQCQGIGNRRQTQNYVKVKGQEIKGRSKTTSRSRLRDRKSKVATKQRQDQGQWIGNLRQQQNNVNRNSKQQQNNTSMSRDWKSKSRHKTTSRSRDREFKVDTKRQGQGIGNLRQ